ncbi:putative late blight resistance protein homolog R1B-23 isoform X2 [Lycium ferocissimum]|uniref:putative late blight resistance protein homolog R1B-23 isoform X2 n=1 Tax=Lycium ferocissimum TaxID=112874 RepID=UPI002815D7A5|nr:putative late blight resistance protein homolog R1B-23 isoform X2 [Lycium ferocissimum]
MKYQILKALQQIEDLWGLDLPETLEDRIKFLKREFRFLDIFLSLQIFIDLPYNLDLILKVEALFQDATARLSVNEFHDGDDVINEIQHLDNVTNQLQVKIGMTKLDMRAKYPFPIVYYYNKDNPKYVLEFIDTVVGNLGDLLKIYCSGSLLFVPGPKKELGDVFKELKLLRNFVCFVSDRSIEPKSQQTDFFTHVLEVAGRAAMVSWLYLPRNGDDNQDMDPAKMNDLLFDLLRTKIKPIQPSIRKIYIDVLQALRWIIQSQRYPIVQIEHVADCAAGFVGTLKHNLKALPISNPGTHQIADLQEMLDLLIANLSHLSVQDLEFHLQDIDTVMIDSGLLVYSLCEDVALEEVTIDWPSTIQRIKTLIYHINRKEFQSNLPRIHGIGYVDFLLNNLKEFQDRYPDALAFVKTQLQIIQTELDSLQPFFAEEQYNTHHKLQNSVTLLIGKAYEVEYTVDACVSKQVPDWCIELWLSDIMKEITTEVKRIQQKKIVEVGLVSPYTLATDTSHKSSELEKWPRINEKIVGFEDVIKTLQDRVILGSRELEIISIVGMPGAGKTTLAKRLYFDELVVSHFAIRVQCYVSPVYSWRGLVLSLLGIKNGSIDETSPLHSMETNELVDILRRSLYSKRYLILIDDVWHPRVWDDLACCFPEMAMGSRILLTTRNDDVANNVKSVSEPLCLRLLSYEESWELLKMKVFGDESCSPLLEEVGQEIARKCGGLPLSIVLVAGILSKMEKTEECWSQVAKDLGSYIASDAKAIIEPSYQYLPYHLKPCFLYFGTFLEDKEINISKLTWLWTGEGFVKDLEGHSSQDIAEHYLEDLIHRNLVMDTKSSDGKVKSCRVHGLLLDFCKRRAEEEHLLLWIKRDQKANPSSGICSHEQLVQRRLAFAEVDNLVEWSSTCCPVGSVLYREDNRIDISSRQLSQIFYNFKFLKVLDLESIVIHSFPTVLVYLRYFAAQTAQDSITSFITNLWNLETLILKSTKGKLDLPVTIWKLVRLRHLRIDNIYFTLNGAEGLLEKLEVLSSPCFSCLKDVELLSRKIPNLRELRCSFVDFRHDFFPKLDFLTRLETLEIHLAADSMVGVPYNFPSSLRNLTLSNFFLGSCHESNISKLPNLQVLKLVSIFFDNDEWDVRDDEFEALKVLKLVKCEFLEEWKAPHNAFPKLEHLVLRECPYLKAIPLRFGDLTSLKSIKVKSCSESVERSATDIKRHQEDVYMDSGLKDFIEKEKRDRLSEQVSDQKQVMDDDDDFVEEVSDPKSKNLKPNVPAKANTVQKDVDYAKPSTYIKKKLVLRLYVRGNDQKCRTKALKIAVSQPGVEAAAITGEERNHLEVVGEQIDVVALTNSLRKKLGHVQLVSIGSAGGGYKEDEKAGQYSVCRTVDQDKRRCSVM